MLLHFPPTPAIPATSSRPNSFTGPVLSPPPIKLRLRSPTSCASSSVNEAETKKPTPLNPVYTPTPPNRDLRTPHSG
ncbi:hypothetical protein Tsubulata_020805 [Turnera subulata]|uniref:Uncharacterized protein n=1 Tax=Turnera subulata TaxID=218843 RepID=A0A9Q0FG04_9ROSI|nr:hypothetical protein Tsubulata_020805 [Turnera subulata]